MAASSKPASVIGGNATQPSSDSRGLSAGEISCVMITAVGIAVATRAAAKRVGKEGAITDLDGFTRACNSRLVWLVPYGLTSLELGGVGLQNSQLHKGLSSLAGLTKVDLSRNNLTQFPRQLLHLKRLITLDLSRNSITSLPPGIGGLRRLKRLNLMHNKLTGALEEGIGCLDSLEVLGLKGNCLTSLCESIGGCTALVELYVTDNQLTTLPKSIGKCKHLRKIQASFNNITFLPPEMEGLESLEMIRMAANPCLSDVPAFLSQLPSLSWMSLAGSLWSVGLGMWEEPCDGPRICRMDLKFGKKLGEGASGLVYLGSLGKQEVALKVFKGDLGPDGRVVDELEISSFVNHPNITKILHILPGDHAVAVMNLVPLDRAPLADRPCHGSELLRCTYESGATWTPEAVMRIGSGIAKALAYLHAHCIAHGDVYAHNILADAEGNATLCDFGASFMYPPGDAGNFEAIEVRAFGLLLQELAQRGGRGVTWIAEDLAAQCLSPKPSARPTFAELGNQLEAELMQAIDAKPGTAKERARRKTPGGEGSRSRSRSPNRSRSRSPRQSPRDER